MSKFIQIILSLIIVINISIISTFDYKPSYTAIIVECETTAYGSTFEVVVEPSWSKHGSKRFLDLVDNGYFTNIPIYRVVYNYIVGFGTNPNTKEWEKKYRPIIDESRRPEHNDYFRGFIGLQGVLNNVNTRNLDFYIAMTDNYELGTLKVWDVPFGFISKTSLDKVVGRFNGQYGDNYPNFDRGLEVAKIRNEGEEYLKKFPRIDRILSCRRKQKEEL